MTTNLSWPDLNQFFHYNHEVWRVSACFNFGGREVVNAVLVDSEDEGIEFWLDNWYDSINKGHIQLLSEAYIHNHVTPWKAEGF